MKSPKYPFPNSPSFTLPLVLCHSSNFLLFTLKLSTPFLHGSSSISKAPSSHPPLTFSPPSFLASIRAMKSMQGKVVCATNDKTVAVEVVRLAPHPKYKRGVRKKKYQAHDPENQFKVGDVVQSQHHNSTKGYMLLLSSGSHFLQRMPATPKNKLVHSGQLQKGSACG